LYNVPPARLKDLPYIDVLAEAVNSPLRVMLGWLLVVPGEFPGLPLILAFWMAGGFEMSRKRLRELRSFDDPAIAAQYRKSFAHYDERRLRSSMIAYGLAAAVCSLLAAWRIVPFFDS